MTEDDALVAELYGGPKDGEEVTLDHVPRDLSFPHQGREHVYRFARQMGQRRVRYDYDGAR